MTEQKKPRITVSPRSADVDVEAIIARRLEGNPFSGATTDIPMRDAQKWDTYIANGDLHSARLHEMTHIKGWLPVTEADLPEGVTAADIGFSVSPTGALCRGPRNQEVVFKMAKEHRAIIQKRKTEANNKGIGSESALKSELANALGSQHGDEAGTFVQNNLVVRGGDTVQQG